MDTKYDKLLDIIANSIENVEDKFFNFRVAGTDKTMKRERVYCGELYHQMRRRFDSLDYDLNIEPDKKSHPEIEKHCGPINPDLVVHRMDKMGPEDNLAVIEIKSSEGNLSSGIKNDLEKLNCLTSIPNGYFGGIIIVFGALTERRQRNLEGRIKRWKPKNIRRLTLILQLQPEESPAVFEL